MPRLILRYLVQLIRVGPPHVYLKWSSGDCCAVSIHLRPQRQSWLCIYQGPRDSHILDKLLSLIVTCNLSFSNPSSIFLPLSLILLLVDIFSLGVALFLNVVH